MKQKIRWITQTAIMLALLITLQALTKGFGQLVTGSCVNAVLAISALLGGMGCGIVVAFVSPILAFLLGIAPQILTVPVIMTGNAVYVVLLSLLAGHSGKLLGRMGAWLAAAAAKFMVLYAGVVFLICGVFAETLLEKNLLKTPMLKLLPATFGWPQLITALLGGGIALLIVPILRRGLRKG